MTRHDVAAHPAPGTHFPAMMKELWILRHGQAMHNVRAEVAKANGCNFQEFLRLMELDDVLDAPLTAVGREQARSVVVGAAAEIVVASPLSRTIQTADLAFPNVQKRMIMEDFREINGMLLNARRRTRTELEQRFPQWDLESIVEEDELWTTELEDTKDAGQRGYEGLKKLNDFAESSIALVGHGGVLKYLMEHERVSVKDAREDTTTRSAQERFLNCELRKYFMTLDADAQIISLVEQDYLL